MKKKSSPNRIQAKILYKVKDLKNKESRIRKKFWVELFSKKRTHGLFVVLFLITPAFRSQTGGFGESHTAHILEEN